MQPIAIYVPAAELGPACASLCASGFLPVLAVAQQAGAQRRSGGGYGEQADGAHEGVCPCPDDAPGVVPFTVPHLGFAAGAASCGHAGAREAPPCGH